MKIRVLVSGAEGRMGREVVHALRSSPDFELVGTAERGENLEEKLAKLKPTIAVDFTHPEAVFFHASTFIAYDVHPVIGTTGLSLEQIATLTQACNDKKLGGIIAPNFSLSAILLMRFSQEAARYFSHVEIVEAHHARKVDAPSGTALKTAQLISEIDQHASVPIHSIRLPGFVATQEVIFGAEGETLSLKAQTIDRSAFMPGVLLACRKVTTLEYLVYGLETLL